MAFSNQTIDHMDIKNLMLDPLNPRLGELAEQTITQEQIVSLIINNFGIDDLLSSMAFNGYFDAEPLVCQERSGQYYVIEGNRRLVACLVLTEDERAQKHIRDFQYYIKLHKEKNKPNVSSLPIVIFGNHEDPKRISAYLGIRHIVSTKDWDSFAKARWIHETIINTGISISDISTMTGDKSNTIKSLLSGYNFMTQLESERKFKRENTVRKGRGSNVSYPFSWVYTLFNYPTARNFLELSFFDENQKPNPRPIPENKLDDAIFVIDSMFGNSNKGQHALLNDSREISKFADALGDPNKVHLLKNGKALKDVYHLTTDINTRLETIFFDCIQLFEEATNRITKEPRNLKDVTITETQPKIIHVNNLLKSINKQLIEARINSTDELDI